MNLIIAQGNSEFFFYLPHSFYFKDVFDKNPFIVLVSHESTQVPCELLMQKYNPLLKGIKVGLFQSQNK